MNKKKIISTILACAMLPFGGLISASAQDTKPTYVQLNPADASPFNNGEFQGWGTALCWWANRLGYSEKLTNAAAEAFFFFFVISMKRLPNQSPEPDQPKVFSSARAARLRSKSFR